MNAKTFLLLFIIFCISDCEKIELGETFNCHMGITCRVTDDLLFKINSLNDSRCPENMMCFWAGECYLDFTINLKNTSTDTVLYLNPAGHYPYQFDDYNFSVLDVRPISGGTTSSKYITIKMLITKN
jgi:hypothetical protein